MPRIFGVYLFFLIEICSSKECNLYGKSVNCSNGQYNAFLGSRVDILYFRNNSLRDLDLFVKVDVSYLYLEWNKIRSLGSSFPVRSLKQLHLAHNQIEVVPKTTFLGMVDLKILILSHNRVNVIDKDAFVYMRELQKLFLDDNRIEDLRFVQHLNGVKYLNLSKNLISTVDEFVGASLVNLTVLDLRYNYITTLAHGQFLGTGTKMSVLLQNNPNIEGCCPITMVRRVYNAGTGRIEYSLNSVALCCSLEQQLPNFEACGVNCTVSIPQASSTNYTTWAFAGLLVVLATLTFVAVLYCSCFRKAKQQNSRVTSTGDKKPTEAETYDVIVPRRNDLDEDGYLIPNQPIYEEIRG